jgi:cytosine/adenosine deaminase-related metal-dependent hydrolase
VLGISPHTLYTVTWEDLVETGVLAMEHSTPITMHLLETAEEAEWLPDGGGFLQTFLARYRLPTVSRAGRGRAIDLLRQAGLLHQRPLLAHVNYLDDQELEELASSGASVVWCPRSHRFFGHPPHRWLEMLDAGVNVCLGTDSLASNETLSILDEMRHLRRAAPEVDPGLILEMGTRRGAAGLGLDSHLGSLRSGMGADFVVIPWDAAGPADPILNLLEGSGPVSGVWIGGTEVSPQA